MNAMDKSLKRAALVTPSEVDEAVERLAEKVVSDGSADVAYAEHDSPLGTLLLASTRRGVLRVSYGPHDDTLDRIAEKVSPRIVRAPAALDPVRRELDEYFEGTRHDFDLPLDLRASGEFVRKVLRATAKIPYGKVISYRDVARRAGNERAVRAAGNALGTNPLPIIVPCHRVVRTGGSLGGYTGGLEKKEFLLQLEGVL